MNILIIGSGGREFAIGARLKQNAHKLFFSPGNGATTTIGENIKAKNYYELAKFAKDNKIDLTIVGPENALSDGIVDIFRENSLNIFGPSKEAARLESSKTFMKEFLAKNGIRTAKFINTDNYEEACKFIDTLRGRVVIKADGLCAGKGVIVASGVDEAKQAAFDMLHQNSFGEAGKKIVVEEFLDGFELSFFAICDGDNFVTLPVAQDHKRLLDNDKGPNTGGMGAYAPSLLASDELIETIQNDIVVPTLRGMKELGSPFCGVLFVGIMVVNNVPYVLEFNVRFGDPECEVLMPLIDGDLGEILLDAAANKLTKIKIKNKFAVGVVISSENYPYKASPIAEISVDMVPEDSHIDYAGVSAKDGKLYADGGRILVAVGLADSIGVAQAKAYELVKNIKFSGMHYRKDIAYQAIK